jgi:hypothetical protein
MTRPPQPPISPLDLRPTSSSEPAVVPARPAQLINRKFQLNLGIGVILVALSAGLWLWHELNIPRVPTEAAKQVLFSIYMPSKLPSGYHINPDSYESRQGVLVFSAQNNTGDHITFSMQARPQDYDFSSFYQRSLKETKKVIGAPYSAVIGKAENDTTLLSIEADRTWLIITSRAQNPNQNLEFIAKHIVKR